jgi:hypothetical protein
MHVLNKILVLWVNKDLESEINRLVVATEEYHDVELIKITMYQPMLCQPNDETKYCVKNIICML